MRDVDYRVFISHGWHDRWVASQIARCLAASGATSFVDVFGIQTGDDIEDRIFDELPSCRELLVLLTPRSVNRNWVWVEVGAARALHLRIVPILYGVTLEDIERDKGGKTFIGAKNALDLNDIEVYLTELTKRVDEVRRAI